MSTYRNQAEKALHPNMLWSRPLSKRSAGRLLIVGGHSGTFAGLQTLYQLTVAAGIGECKLAVPDLQSKLLGPTGLAIFLPTTPGGSIAKGALGQLMYEAEDYDAVLIGADLTANSETSTVIEHFLSKSQARVILTNEALDALKFAMPAIMQRPNTLIVTDMARVAQLTTAGKVRLQPGLEGNAGKAAIVLALAEQTQPHYAVVGSDIITATGTGQPVLTPLPTGHIGHRLPLAIALAGVLWTQQREKPDEALATAAFLARETLRGVEDQPKITVTTLTGALTKRQREAEDAAFGG